MFLLEKALHGGRRYWLWVALLLLLIGAGFLAYLRQLNAGLAVTGMSRDVSWGLYIGQFTFFVGVAASAVMVVLPFYFHNVKAFAKVTLLGELLAIAAVLMCMLFIFVDLGQPMRVMNVLLYPSPHSMMFWDMLSLSGYLLLNLLIAAISMDCKSREVSPPRWLRPVICFSVPWAVSIHTVTAFLYCGLPGRSLWLTAILAPRFLASAFAAGPALLLLICLLLRRISRFDAGLEAVQKLGVIVAYAMSLNVFFLLLELFTAFYSAIPEHRASLLYLYHGINGSSPLATWMGASSALAALSLLLLLTPPLRRSTPLLALASAMVFVSLWIDKGMGLIVAGFVPSPLEELTPYSPTLIELAVVTGVWALGALVLTIFYKAAISLQHEPAEMPSAS